MHKLFLITVRGEPSLETYQEKLTTRSVVISRAKKSVRKTPMMTVRRLTFCLAFSVACAPSAAAQTGSRHTTLRIGLVTADSENASSGAASIARGVRLGAAESKQTAALFGDNVELYEVDGAGGGALSSAERLLSARKIQVLISASVADADALSGFAESQHILFMNAASRAQSVRSACRRHTFHVEATDTMYAKAARDSRDSAALWAPGLERFGASQLNDRYRARYGTGMNGSAWAGWIAVKVVAEATLRTRSTSPAALLGYMEAPTTQFDGHKGWPLTFRGSDHQLRQPLYLASRVEGGAYRFRDVPELRADSSSYIGSDTGTRATDRVLDRLIAVPGGRQCAWR
jgi:ABC-type branched-subunit amino acid transport system substrate-binding protein